jgi:hypothetical protein
MPSISVQLPMLTLYLEVSWVYSVKLLTLIIENEISDNHISIFHFSYDSTFNILIASTFERSINFLGI